MSYKHIISKNKILLENFSYLSILQIFNLASPLITYPYLLRLFGLDLYGTIIFAQAIATNIAIIINYGFNLSGTQAIATNYKQKETIDEIVNSIYTIKTLIWIVCFCIYAIIVLSINKISEFRSLYIISYFLTINDVLLPIWFFQGIEKMKYITFINIVTRLFFIVLIFILVKTPIDYIYVPLLNSIGAVLGGFIALYIVFKVHKVKYYYPRFIILKKYFSASTPFFISSLSVNVYANISRLIVGSFLGMKDVAIYDMAAKITGILKIPGSLISQASFPRICKTKSLRFVNKLMFISVGTITVLYLFDYMLANKIVYFLSGEYILGAEKIIRILTLTSICGVFNSFFGSNRLVVWGYKQTYMKIAMSGCFIYLFFFSILYLLNMVTLISITFLPLISEFSIVMIYLFVANRFKLLYSKITQ